VKAVARIPIVVLGLLAVVAGEFDDSPGLQGLGMIVVLAVAVGAVREHRHRR